MSCNCDNLFTDRCSLHSAYIEHAFTSLGIPEHSCNYLISQCMTSKSCTQVETFPPTSNIKMMDNRGMDIGNKGWFEYVKTGDILKNKKHPTCRESAGRNDLMK